ncbi:hypothetical protein B0B52_19700 [Polaromonas sp. A23]|nr:hypothetical protein B0B52_19700 [Polaromonas sp. A23]
MSFAFGVLAFLSFVGGYKRSLELPDIPRPNVGPGFSESATAMFGGAFVGLWLALGGIALGLLAQLVGPRRAFKFALSVPALAYLAMAVFGARL